MMVMRVSPPERAQAVRVVGLTLEFLWRSSDASAPAVEWFRMLSACRCAWLDVVRSVAFILPLKELGF